MTLAEKLELACWIAEKLFDRKMGPGTTGNLSFIHEGRIYITASGTCFGNLSLADFTCADPESSTCHSNKPSKELSLHKIAYALHPQDQAVIHVHSTYAVLWSCISHENEADCIPAYTPYLKMMLGKTGLIPYAKPGSDELFDHFREKGPLSDGWILKNHGPVVTGKDLMNAFARIEELEESCRIAWELQGKDAFRIR